MNSDDRAVARKQLDKRLGLLLGSDVCTRPPRGWVKAIREALGMTTAQVAARMGVSQPRIVEIEKAEKSGTTTLNTLERAAQAMDCKLVYAFVPKKPLAQLVEDRALIIAKQRMVTTGHNMALEAQSVSFDDEKEQLEQMVRRIVEKAGSDIWKD